MILHFHYSRVPNSGDVKRIVNINNEMCGICNSQSVEVLIGPASEKEKCMTSDYFTLSNNVVKKHYLKMFNVRSVGPIITAIKMMMYVIKYRPSLVIVEWIIPYFFVEMCRLLCPKTTLIADIHGAVTEECIYLEPDLSQSIIKRKRRSEAYTERKADYVICQSDEMRKYMNRTYGVPMDRICVYRCGYDTTMFKVDATARESIRQKLNIGDDLLFVYAGGLHGWQKIESTLLLYKKYHEVNPNSKFLVLTGNQQILQQKIEEGGLTDMKDSIISFSVPFTEVPKYLNAADVAFLIRDNHIMNAVASPTKLAEYLSCGLYVISSEVAKYWVNADGLKYIIDSNNIDSPNVIDSVVKSTPKTEISAYAKSYLSLDIDHANINKFFAGKLRICRLKY